MIEHNYNGIYRRNQADGIVLSLPFATPSMAPLTADQAPNLITGGYFSIIAFA